MPPRKRQPHPVRFVKEYGNWVGNRFRRYETPDGRVAEIRVRAGFNGSYEYTNAEAKAAAVAQLYPKPARARRR
jgi:hypothetical protein